MKIYKTDAKWLLELNHQYVVLKGNELQDVNSLYFVEPEIIAIWASRTENRQDQSIFLFRDEVVEIEETEIPKTIKDAVEVFEFVHI